MTSPKRVRDFYLQNMSFGTGGNDNMAATLCKKRNGMNVA